MFAQVSVQWFYSLRSTLQFTLLLAQASHLRRSRASSTGAV
jgi:hypothetical protein